MIFICNLNLKSALHANVFVDSQGMSVVAHTVMGHTDRGRKELYFEEVTRLHFKNGLGGFLQKYTVISRHSLFLAGGRG